MVRMDLSEIALWQEYIFLVFVFSKTLIIQFQIEIMAFGFLSYFLLSFNNLFYICIYTKLKYQLLNKTYDTQYTKF